MNFPAPRRRRRFYRSVRRFLEPYRDDTEGVPRRRAVAKMAEHAVMPRPRDKSISTIADPLDEKSQLEAGVAHHRAGRLDAARSCYERVLAINPDNVQALDLLGVVHAFQGRGDEAIPL